MTTAQKITDYASKQLNKDKTGTTCLLLTYTPAQNGEELAFCGKIKGMGGDIVNLLANYSEQLPEFKSMMLSALTAELEE